MHFTIDLTEQTLPAKSEAGHFLASLQQDLITSELCDNLTCDDGEFRVSDNYGMDFEEERALYIRAGAEIAKLKELLAMDNATAIHRFSREKTYCQSIKHRRDLAAFVEIPLDNLNAKVLHHQISDRPTWDVVSFIGLDTSDLTTPFVGKQSEIQVLLHALVQVIELIEGCSSSGAEFADKMHLEIDGNVFFLKSIFEYGVDPSDLHLLVDSLTNEQVESLRLYVLELGHQSSSFWEWQPKFVGEVVAENLAKKWFVASISLNG